MLALLMALTTMPVVHVETEVGTHVLVERVDAHGNTEPVCMAPCDQPLDASASYRLRSDTFRTTNHFQLKSTDPERQVVVRVTEERSTKSLVSAIVLMSLSGVFATAGAFVSGFGALRWMDTGVAIGVAIPLFTMHLATGIPGAVLFANSIQSRATAVEGERIQRLEARKPAFTVPILSGSF
jgi:hypothetical protein